MTIAGATMFAPFRTVAPASLPVSLAEAKAHCRIDGSEEDALVGLLIDAAVSHLDGWTGVLGRCLVTQTWRIDYAEFSEQVRVPLWPVQSVTVSYIDVAGVTRTLASNQYELRNDGEGAFVCAAPGLLWPVTGESNSAVSVTAVCGAPASEVPAAIKAAMLLMVGDMYRNRETVAIGAAANMIPMSATVDRLLAPFRRVMA